jgi:hypothetical protein
MDRRTFIKRVFQVAGVAGLVRMGLLAEARGIFPAALNTGGAGTGSSWSTWDEASELTLAIDQNQDGMEDTNITFMKNPVAGGDEISRGVVSGLDLIYTQVNNVVGALGVPPYRTIGVTQGFTAPINFVQTMCAGTNGFIIIIKLKYTSALAGSSLFRWEGGNDRVQADVTALDVIRVYYRKDAVDISAFPTDFTDPFVTGTTYYFCMWGTASVARAAFSTTKPTKWSDFAANKRMTFASDFRFTGTDFGATQKLSFDGGATSMQGDFFYCITSQSPGSFINDAA